MKIIKTSAMEAQLDVDDGASVILTSVRSQSKKYIRAFVLAADPDRPT